jgi:uncharacterized Fe-S cluster-containing protein
MHSVASPYECIIEACDNKYILKVINDCPFSKTCHFSHNYARRKENLLNLQKLKHLPINSYNVFDHSRSFKVIEHIVSSSASNGMKATKSSAVPCTTRPRAWSNVIPSLVLSTRICNKSNNKKNKGSCEN